MSLVDGCNVMLQDFDGNILAGALITHFIKCLIFRFLAIPLNLLEQFFNVIAYFDLYNQLMGNLQL